MSDIKITKEEYQDVKKLIKQFSQFADKVEKIQETEKNEQDKVLKGLYLEPKINEAIDKHAKHGERSKLVNELLEQQLKKHDLL